MTDASARPGDPAVLSELSELSETVLRVLREYADMPWGPPPFPPRYLHELLAEHDRVKTDVSRAKTDSEMYSGMLRAMARQVSEFRRYLIEDQRFGYETVCERDAARSASGILHEWALRYRRALVNLAQPCCDLHGRVCEPPSELCCGRCSEADHPGHHDGTTCAVPDLSPLIFAAPDMSSHTPAVQAGRDRLEEAAIAARAAYGPYENAWDKTLEYHREQWRAVVWAVIAELGMTGAGQ